jgi:hypothetical protein
MAKAKKTNFDRHLERELKKPKFVKGFCEELEKTRLAIKKSTKGPFENIIGIGKSGIKDGSIKHNHYLYDKTRKELLSKFGKYINHTLESKGVKEEKILEDFKTFKKSRRAYTSGGRHK